MPAPFEDPKDFQEVGRNGMRKWHIRRKGSDRTLCGTKVNRAWVAQPLLWIQRVGCKHCRDAYWPLIKSVADWQQEV